MASTKFKGNPVQTSGSIPAAGGKAPDAVLTGVDLADVKISSFVGSHLVLNIFPSVDTGVCAASVRRFNEAAGSLTNAKVLCISRNLPFAQKRFCARKESPTSRCCRRCAASRLAVRMACVWWMVLSRASSAHRRRDRRDRQSGLRATRPRDHRRTGLRRSSGLPENAVRPVGWHWLGQYARVALAWPVRSGGAGLASALGWRWLGPCRVHAAATSAPNRSGSADRFAPRAGVFSAAGQTGLRGQHRHRTQYQTQNHPS